jgi:hypothetical protein
MRQQEEKKKKQRDHFQKAQKRGCFKETLKAATQNTKKKTSIEEAFSEGNITS